MSPRADSQVREVARCRTCLGAQSGCPQIVRLCATHTYPNLRAWLEQNPRIHMPDTTTSGSCLNLIEVFFGIIQRQAIKLGTFASVKDLIAAITTFLKRWNDGLARRE